MGVVLIIVIIVLIFIIIIPIGIYNSLVKKRNRYRNAFSQIDVQLKRRYDLIPNLVETAKGYLKHEKEVLESLTKARNIAQSAISALKASPSNADAMNRLAQAESSMTGALGTFYAVAENYPDLKANQTMAQLMEELASTENKVSFARQAYNDSVMDYNTSREVFPNTLLAGAFGFTPAVLFEVPDEAERSAVKVTF